MTKMDSKRTLTDPACFCWGRAACCLEMLLLVTKKNKVTFLLGERTTYSVFFPYLHHNQYPISVSSSLLRPFRVRHVSHRSLRSYYSRTGRPSWPSGTRCRQLHRIEPNCCRSEPILVRGGLPSQPPCNPLLKRIYRWPADL